MLSFKKYNKKNPLVWGLFVKYSKEARKKGFKTYSAKGIFEIIRWHTEINGTEGFKLNNNYHPDYARKLMKTYPKFQGFFKIRERKSLM